jgi:hypothetical protein
MPSNQPVWKRRPISTTSRRRTSAMWCSPRPIGRCKRFYHERPIWLLPGAPTLLLVGAAGAICGHHKQRAFAVHHKRFRRVNSRRRPYPRLKERPCPPFDGSGESSLVRIYTSSCACWLSSTFRRRWSEDRGHPSSLWRQSDSGPIDVTWSFRTDGGAGPWFSNLSRVISAADRLFRRVPT